MFGSGGDGTSMGGKGGGVIFIDTDRLQVHANLLSFHGPDYFCLMDRMLSLYE